MKKKVEKWRVLWLKDIRITYNINIKLKDLHTNHVQLFMFSMPPHLYLPTFSSCCILEARSHLLLDVNLHHLEVAISIHPTCQHQPLRKLIIYLTNSFLMSESFVCKFYTFIWFSMRQPQVQFLFASLSSNQLVVQLTTFSAFHQATSFFTLVSLTL